MRDLSQALVEDVKQKGGDPFSMAYELTKIYAGSGEAEARDIPRLFLDLYGMFLTGSPGGVKEEAKDKKAKKKDKKKKGDKASSSKTQPA